MPDLIRHLIRRHPHQSRYLRMAAVFFALHPHWRPLVRTEIKIAATGKAAAFCFERKTRHEPAHRAGILAIVALPPAAFGGCPLGGLWGRFARVSYPTKNANLYRLAFFRAENETRTRDPDLGKVVLYQLSYCRNTNFRKSLLKNQILNFQNFLLFLSKAVQRYNKFFKLPNFLKKK